MKRLFRRWGVHIAAGFPLAGLIVQWTVALTAGNFRAAGLSAEPIDYSINYLGLWALRFLLLTLAVTPLRLLTRWSWLAPLRRPLGLWCFAYASLHFLVYFGLDQLLSLRLLWKDVIRHPFILFGMTTWLLLLPLALTSTRKVIKRLGGRRWQALHRLVYGAVAVAAVHFIMRVKGFQIEPWIYAGIAVALLLARLLHTYREKRRRDLFRRQPLHNQPVDLDQVNERAAPRDHLAAVPVHP
ncbi:MAG: protein-methionine-sulfoxide reductase heme-binding subunit MsrQ [Sphingomonadaceae bacterium]|jgi:sulfoxide reductase heme-binding subunit YedZ